MTDLAEEIRNIAGGITKVIADEAKEFYGLNFDAGETLKAHRDRLLEIAERMDHPSLETIIEDIEVMSGGEIIAGRYENWVILKNAANGLKKTTEEDHLLRREDLDVFFDGKGVSLPE